MHEDSQIPSEGNKTSSDQSAREVLQHLFHEEQTDGRKTSETEPPSNNQSTAKINSTTSEATFKESNNNDLIIPREEFTLIDDPDSLEDIVIYDIVIEYQATVTIRNDDIIEIKPEPQERAAKEAAESSSQTEKTMSQIIVDHEEIVSAQEPVFDQPTEDPEPEDWVTILLRGKQPEGWGRDGIHEEDMAIITRDRLDTTPTNRDCISNIYGYYVNDNPAIPTEIYYRWCKLETTAEGMHRRENFRSRRRNYFDGPAIKKGDSWYPKRYIPDPEDPEWSWKDGLEMEMPAMSAYQLNEGKVIWDPYKHLRNKGEHPYYCWTDMLIR